MELIEGLYRRAGVRFYTLFVILLAVSATSVFAQEVRLEATVEFIAGQDIYLSVGSEDGIGASDSLVAFRGNEQLGPLRIVGVTTSRTVATFAGEPFAVTRGDVLTIVVRSGENIVDESIAQQPQDSVAQPGRQSVFEQGTTGRQFPPVEEGIRVSGRLALGMDLTSSTTNGVRSAGEQARNYQIPSANLRARVEELPGGLRVNVDSRFAYRNSESALGINPLNSLRIYQLNIEHDRPGSAFEGRVGRFFNPAETFSGFWDGAGLAYAPDEGFGAGALAGFQPDRADEGFSDELPKYTVFGSFAHRAQEAQYNANLSFHQVFPSDPLLSTHTFLGFSHTFRQKLFRLRNLVQVDQNPENDEWTLTRIQVHGIVPIGDKFSLRARYFLRRPYQIYRAENQIGYERDRISGGFTMRAFTGVVSADVSTNSSDIEGRSYTYTSFVNIPQINLFDLGFSTLVHYWTRGSEADVIYVAPALFRYFGRAYTQLQYQYQQSSFDEFTAANHAVEWSVNFPVGRRLRSSIRLQSRWGDTTSMYRLFTTLWMKI